MSTAATSQEPLQLDWRQQNRRIVVTPEDEDRYILTVQEAIRSCRVAEQSVLFDRQFRTLRDHLATWIRDNLPKIGRAFLTVHDGEWLFLVLTRLPKCDERFEEELTKLDLEVAQDRRFHLLRFNVLALPDVSEQALRSFISTRTLEYRRAK